MRGRRIVLLGGAVIVLALIAAVYYLFDPMEAGWMPRCIWKVATGTDCPGCGSQRMAHALLHGDIRAAWHANAYALCMLPLMAGLLWLETFREKHPSLYRKMHSPLAVEIVAGSVVGWWILRNLV